MTLFITTAGLASAYWMSEGGNQPLLAECGRPAVHRGRQPLESKHPPYSDTAPITVFAAVSTTDVLAAIAADYERRHGQTIRLSFASSSTLARQIEAGAPADVYLSANPRWMDHLDKAGLIRPGTRCDLLANRLVLIAPRGQAFMVRAKPGFSLASAFSGRLALGDPEHVPAGIYAREAMEHLVWYGPLRSRLLPGRTVWCLFKAHAVRCTGISQPRRLEQAGGQSPANAPNTPSPSIMASGHDNRLTRSSP